MRENIPNDSFSFRYHLNFLSSQHYKKISFCNSIMIIFSTYKLWKIWDKIKNRSLIVNWEFIRYVWSVMMMIYYQDDCELVLTVQLLKNDLSDEYQVFVQIRVDLD